MKRLFLIVLSMLVVEIVDSIHLLYRYFGSKEPEKSINDFYIKICLALFCILFYENKDLQKMSYSYRANNI